MKLCSKSFGCFEALFEKALDASKLCSCIECCVYTIGGSSL